MKRAHLRYYDSMRCINWLFTKTYLHRLLCQNHPYLWSIKGRYHIANFSWVQGSENNSHRVWHSPTYSLSKLCSWVDGKGGNLRKNGKGAKCIEKTWETKGKKRGWDGDTTKTGGRDGPPPYFSTQICALFGAAYVLPSPIFSARECHPISVCVCVCVCGRVLVDISVFNQHRTTQPGPVWIDRSADRSAQERKLVDVVGRTTALWSRGLWPDYIRSAALCLATSHSVVSIDEIHPISYNRRWKIFTRGNFDGERVHGKRRHHC